jgi:hypothetical protein
VVVPTERASDLPSSMSPCPGPCVALHDACDAELGERGQSSSTKITRDMADTQKTCLSRNPATKTSQPPISATIRVIMRALVPGRGSRNWLSVSRRQPWTT